MMLSPQDMVEHALAASNADDCIAIVRNSTSANLRWANNTLTTNGVMSSVSLTVIAFSASATGIRTASISGSATTRDDVLRITQAADAAASSSSDAEDAGELVADRTSPDWTDGPENTGIEIYDEFATALGEAFAQAQDGARLLYGFVNHEILTTYLGSSRGLRLRHVQPTGHYGCTGKDTSLTRSAWAGGATRDFVGVDALALADEVAERLSWAKRRIELPAGRYDTILPPSCVADLIIDAYWSAGARVAHDGESVYSRRGGGTRLGEQLARPGVNLYSDPARHEVSSAPFAIAAASDNTESVFDNGLPLARTDWIKDGLLESLVSTRHSAQMIDRAVTPYVDNLILDVDGALAGMADLVADTKRGLLLTCLWYIREVDPQSLLLTGLTRDGVYVIEDGEIVGVANNFRWNESPVDLLNRFTGASQTVPSFSREWGEDYFSRTATPALRVPDFNMSSVSQGV